MIRVGEDHYGLKITTLAEFSGWRRNRDLLTSRKENPWLEHTLCHLVWSTFPDPPPLYSPLLYPLEHLVLPQGIPEEKLKNILIKIWLQKISLSWLTRNFNDHFYYHDLTQLPLLPWKPCSSHIYIYILTKVQQNTFYDINQSNYTITFRTKNKVRCLPLDKYSKIKIHECTHKKPEPFWAQ